MSFDDVKQINSHLGHQPRKSKEAMVGQIVKVVGQDLQILVSDESPFLLKRWNEIITEFGGSPRKSFADVAEEFEASLDPAFDEFDGDIPIIELRDNNADLRLLARKLGIDKAELTQLISEAHGRTLLAKFVADFREHQSASWQGSSGVSKSVCVASTRIDAETVEKLSLPWMVAQTSGADHISIAAGFYDADFLRSLLNKHRTVQRVRLLFNGLGGYRLQTQCNELRELKRELRSERRSVDIRLAFAPGMFHSKLFLITKNDSTIALVGSANATNAAFTRNEEVLISLPDAGALVNYFESAWDGAKTLDGLDVAAKTLIAFFRTGILYFKPVATLATTLNPFNELLNELTPEQRVTLGGVELQHSELATGVGPFSLKLAIQGRSDGDSEGSESVESGDDPVERATVASIKPWSVETCFGYWVPSALDAAWRAKGDASGRIKQQRWELFREALDNTPDAVLVEKYQEYLNGFNDRLKVFPNSKSLLAKLKRDPFDLSAFEKFVDRVRNCLADNKRLERLSLPFASGVMPEIWDDAEAYGDFRDSFSDHLSLISRSTSQHRVPKAILSKLHGGDSQSGEQLLAEFETYLEDHGWTDDDWK